jgi:hypothetical protein
MTSQTPIAERVGRIKHLFSSIQSLLALLDHVVRPLHSLLFTSSSLSLFVPFTKFFLYRVAEGGHPPPAPTDPDVHVNASGSSGSRVRCMTKSRETLSRTRWSRMARTPAPSSPIPLSSGVSLRLFPGSMSLASFSPKAPCPRHPPPSTGSLGAGSPASQVLWGTLTPTCPSRFSSLPSFSGTFAVLLVSLPMAVKHYRPGPGY